ncbi:hypothetical protein EO92_05790 [Methanosarcina sp. 2.H.A.1B.4]|nr:hypothetical protein EO92_05790 [Methanosarcina sp. 2.H.A.1B.4]
MTADAIYDDEVLPKFGQHKLPDIQEIIQVLKNICKDNRILRIFEKMSKISFNRQNTKKTGVQT